MTSRPECREVRQRKEATCLGHDAHAIRVCEGALQRVQRQRAAATPKAHHAQLAHLQGRAQQTQHRDMAVSEGAKAAGEAMQEGSLGGPRAISAATAHMLPAHPPRGAPWRGR